MPYYSSEVEEYEGCSGAMYRVLRVLRYLLESPYSGSRSDTSYYTLPANY